MSDTDSTESTPSTDPKGTEKQGGAGGDGTIPPSPDGLAANIGDEGSNFNQEEDPEADTSEGESS